MNQFLWGITAGLVIASAVFAWFHPETYMDCAPKPPAKLTFKVMA